VPLKDFREQHNLELLKSVLFGMVEDCNCNEVLDQRHTEVVRHDVTTDSMSCSGLCDIAGPVVLEPQGHKVIFFFTRRRR